MGGGASRPSARLVALEQLAPLPSPRSSGECMLYTCMPEGDLQKKGEVLLLELGPMGLRILKPSMDPIFLFPWGQIHSWSHGPSRFAFRFFDDKKHSIVQYALATKDVEHLLEYITKVIDVILEERKKSAITDDAFKDLLGALNGLKHDSAHQIDKIRDATAVSTFTADQGRKVLETLPSTFEQIEAAIILHQRLIDQNRFSTMLEILECQTDRDNVWHRITNMKKGRT